MRAYKERGTALFAQPSAMTTSFVVRPPPVHTKPLQCAFVTVFARSRQCYCVYSDLRVPGLPTMFQRQSSMSLKSSTIGHPCCSMKIALTQELAVVMYTCSRRKFDLTRSNHQVDLQRSQNHPASSSQAGTARGVSTDGAYQSQPRVCCSSLQEARGPRLDILP